MFLKVSKIQIGFEPRTTKNMSTLAFASLTVSPGILFLGILFVLGYLPSIPCPFKALTGFPCFSCGMTRMARSLVQGQIGTAFLWNPFMFIFSVFIGVLLLLGWVDALFKKRLVISHDCRLLRKLSAIWPQVVVGLAVLNWIYLVLAGV